MKKYKNSIELARFGGIAAVLLQLGILSYVATKTKFDLFGSDPVSNLGTTNFFGIYAIAFELGGLALIICLAYIRATYHPSRWFDAVMLLGIASEMVTGLVPDNVSNPHVWLEQLTRVHVHGIAATCLFVSIPVAMYLFSMSIEAKKVARQSTGYFWVYVLTFIPGVILMQLHIFYAVSELTSLLIFDVWILTISQALSESATVPAHVAINTAQGRH